MASSWPASSPDQLIVQGRHKLLYTKYQTLLLRFLTDISRLSHTRSMYYLRIFFGSKMMSKIFLFYRCRLSESGRGLWETGLW